MVAVAAVSRLLEANDALAALVTQAPPDEDEADQGKAEVCGLLCKCYMAVVAPSDYLLDCRSLKMTGVLDAFLWAPYLELAVVFRSQIT